MIVTSFQGKQISQSFSYCELINSYIVEILSSKLKKICHIHFKGVVCTRLGSKGQIAQGLYSYGCAMLMRPNKDQLRVCKLWDWQLFIHIIRKSTPRFTKSPSLVVIRLVLTEIQRFKNVKIRKEMYGNPDAVFRQRPGGQTFLFKFRHFQMAVSCLLLGLFTPHLGSL